MVDCKANCMGPSHHIVALVRNGLDADMCLLSCSVHINMAYRCYTGLPNDAHQKIYVILSLSENQPSKKIVDVKYNTSSLSIVWLSGSHKSFLWKSFTWAANAVKYGYCFFR